MVREMRINTAPRGNRVPLLNNGETSRILSDLEEGSNVQAANVGFCRVIKLAKHDAGKLVFATIALLVASLSNLLVPKYGGKIIDIVSRDVQRPEDKAQALADVNGTILYIVLIVLTGSVCTALRAWLFNSASERVVARLRSKRTPMGTLAAAIPVTAAATATASSHAGGRRRRRGSVAVRCSSAADERQALFSRIAPVYDHLNDVLSLGQHRTWKRICVSWSMAKRGDRVLDLCCGSGDLAFLLSQKVGLDGEVMGVDFSGQQLQTAASRQDQRWKACYKNIKWIEGDALDLPFTDGYFDAVTVGYGLRNVVDKPKAMREILRVLKPGSRASVLDFNKSSSFFTASLQSWAIDNVVVPLASSYGLTEEYKYLKSSIAQYLTGEELEKLAKEAGFSSAKHYELGEGLMGNLVATR